MSAIFIDRSESDSGLRVGFHNSESQEMSYLELEIISKALFPTSLQ